MDAILGLVFIFSLLSLAMIFGDRLSLFGRVDERWLVSPFNWATRFWQMLCEIFDRTVCFVFDHFWWVTATTFGGVGVGLIALIMFSGLTLEAAAVRRDELAIMNVGGVLDHTPRMEAKELVPTPVKQPERHSSHLVDQFPTPDIRFAIQELSRRPEIDALPIERPYLPIERSPEDFAPTPDPFRSRLRLTLNPFVEIQGRRVTDPAVLRMIQQTLYDLRIQDDDWPAFSEQGFQNRQTPTRPDLRENSIDDVDQLLRSVRILPGDTVTTQTIDVKKLMPENPPAGEFDIRIRVINRGQDTLSGLVVREQIPVTATTKAMQPEGVYRETTAVWVVNDLRSGEERDLVLTVDADDGNRFESWTEVSAASAVHAATVVEDPPEARRPIFPPRTPERRELEPREPEPREREPWELDPLEPIRREPIRSELTPLEPLLPETLPRNSVPRDLVLPDPLSQEPEPREPLPIRLPDVRLRLLTRPVQVQVNEVAIVKFEVRNVGNAAAEGVSLRINLPADVDHKELNPRDLLRRVECSIRALKPNERRTMELFVRPTRTGRHLVTARLMLKNSELDLQSFDVVTSAATNRENEFLPVDEAVPRPRPDNGIR